MITANRRYLTFIVSGCGRVERVQVDCVGQECARRVLSLTRLAQPRRLRPTTDRSWVDPGRAAAGRDTGELKPAVAPVMAAPNVGSGQRLSDVHSAPFKPTLPKEINNAGTVVWGVYKVCVGTDGKVDSASVLRSALPGGMDAHWIATIEQWTYAPYVVGGQAVPFCHPARIEVRSQR